MIPIFLLVLLIISLDPSDSVKSKIKGAHEEIPQGCQCGLERIQPRIINGHVISPSKYPWDGQIGNPFTGLPTDRCHVTLITDRHLVGAASCVIFVNGASERFTYDKDGDFIVNQIEDPQFKLVLEGIGPESLANMPGLEIESVVIPKEYVYDKIGNDIVIIKLKEALEFVNGLNPICLPNFEATENLFTYGYGQPKKWKRQD